MGGASGRRDIFLVWLLYAAFVVYGSLVPLEYRPLPFDLAWRKFTEIPLLTLGPEQRADWVANGVLYLPLGFLSMLWPPFRGFFGKLATALGALAFCSLLAFAVEFAQVFFPPRTVSRNDLIAEIIGSVVGILLAWQGGDWAKRLLLQLRAQGERFLLPAFQVYAIVYLAFAFFPYDFLVSFAEIEDRIAASAWGWWLAPRALEDGWIRFAVKLGSEIFAAMPLGMMVALWSERRRFPPTTHSVLFGLLLGLGIETTQFFLYSGTSQGISVLTRVLGVAAGAVAWRERRKLAKLRALAGRGLVMVPAGIAYLVLLALFSGFLDHPRHDLAAAHASWQTTRFLPFYYHYYTTEQAALLSLISVAALYAPIGLFSWLARWRPGGAALVATGIAMAVEAGKAFFEGLHADPTNVLIAGVSALAVARLLGRLSGVGEEGRGVLVSASAGPGIQGHTAKETFLLGLVALDALWVAVDFPYRGAMLALGLLAYAGLLWWRPLLLWTVTLAALPLLDLAPWSGRFYFDEFDHLLLVGVLVGFARSGRWPQENGRIVPALWPTAVLLGVFAFGAMRGLWRGAWSDVQAFSSYYSPWNGIRIAKGALWGFLLLLLARRYEAAGKDVQRPFVLGMVIGLAGTVAVVIWERLVFPGLFDFTGDYRVSGPFSAMHTGGADIEAYLTLAIPFALMELVALRNRWGWLGLVLLVLAAGYALVVTFARAGYLAFAAAVVVSTALLWRWRGASSPRRRIGLTAAVLILVGSLALPLGWGGFAQERFTRIEQDFATRLAHWQETLAMRNDDWPTTLFGMGLGRYPETHYWRSTQPRAGGYGFASEGENRFVRFGTGIPVYLEQLVSVEPSHRYRLELVLRSPQGGAISVALCEKWLLTSARCWSAVFAAEEENGRWREKRIEFDSGEIGAPVGFLRRPVKLSLYNASSAIVEIDRVRLLDDAGHDLLANGGFERGIDRWFFSTDRDLPWHVWSLPVAVLFELGWLGLFGVVGVALSVFLRTLRTAWQGDAQAFPFLAAMTGFFILAAVDTLIDAPRMLLLWTLLSILSIRSRNSSVRI